MMDPIVDVLDPCPQTLYRTYKTKALLVWDQRARSCVDIHIIRAFQ